MNDFIYYILHRGSNYPYVYICIFIGLLAAIFFSGFIESVYLSFKKKGDSVKLSVIYFILMAISEGILFFLALNYPTQRFRSLPEGMKVFYFGPYYTPIQIMLFNTILGLFIYAILQIPYSIYMYIKRDKVRGKRALNRLFVLLVIGGILLLLYNRL